MKEQRPALIAYTEEPIRQGRLDNPWAGTVDGVVLGDAEEAWELFRDAEKDSGRSAETKGRVRPDWEAIVRAAESIPGRR